LNELTDDAEMTLSDLKILAAMAASYKDIKEA